MPRIDSEPEVLGIQESFKYMHQLMFFLRRNYSVVTLPVIGFKKEWTNQKLKTKAEYFPLYHLMYSFLKTTAECR